MMKMNLIAGFVCVTLLSACSSQKIASGDSTPTPVANTGFSTSEPSSSADERATSNNSKELLKSANTAEMPKASYSK